MGDTDHLMRLAAFEHVKRLSDTHDHLTSIDLKPGFMFRGERIPLVDQVRSIVPRHELRVIPKWL